jgi:hypothetical protein
MTIVLEYWAELLVDFLFYQLWRDHQHGGVFSSHLKPSLIHLLVPDILVEFREGVGQLEGVLDPGQVFGRLIRPLQEMIP